jgi:ABC-type multidrug transport system fused ATPase/permease subunit
MVILDEASSRLDPATERLLERALDRLLANRTTIIIAHRLSTVRRADQILILEEGRGQESGSYQSLADDPRSVFASLLRTTAISDERRPEAVETLRVHSTLQNQNSKIEEVLA